MRTCPSCSHDWPEDRFNDKHPECFRCRAGSIQVSFGPAGKQFWHDTTTKEFNDRQIREARSNGLDPVPVATKATAVPSAAGFAALSKALGPKGK